MTKKCLNCNKKLPKRRYRYCSNRCIKSAWRKRNLKRHNETNRIWRKNNPDYFKKWRAENYVYKGRCSNSGSFKKGQIPWNKGKILPTTPIRAYIRQSKRYREWRMKVFVRDSFTCRKCGQKGGWNKKLKKRIFLQADHYPLSLAQILKNYKIKTVQGALACEKLWDIDNGRTLCRDCHKKTKNYGKNLRYES